MKTHDALFVLVLLFGEIVAYVLWNHLPNIVFYTTYQIALGCLASEIRFGDYINKN